MRLIKVIIFMLMMSTSVLNAADIYFITKDEVDQKFKTVEQDLSSQLANKADIDSHISEQSKGFIDKTKLSDYVKDNNIDMLDVFVADNFINKTKFFEETDAAKGDVISKKDLSSNYLSSELMQSKLSGIGQGHIHLDDLKNYITKEVTQKTVEKLSSKEDLLHFGASFEKVGSMYDYNLHRAPLELYVFEGPTATYSSQNLVDFVEYNTSQSSRFNFKIKASQDTSVAGNYRCKFSVMDVNPLFRAKSNGGNMYTYTLKSASASDLKYNTTSGAFYVTGQDYDITQKEVSPSSILYLNVLVGGVSELMVDIDSDFASAYAIRFNASLDCEQLTRTSS